MNTKDLARELRLHADGRIELLPSAAREAAASLVALGRVRVMAEHAHTALTFDVTDDTKRKVAQNLWDALRALESSE